MNKISLGFILSILYLGSSINLYSQNPIDPEIPKNNPAEIIKIAEKGNQKPEQIIQLVDLALTQFSIKDNKELAANAYRILGKVYYQQNQLSSAIDNFKLSAQLYKQLKDSLNYISITDNIGICYQMKSQYSQSLEYLQEALKMSERLDEKKLKPFILNNLGIVYQLTNQLDQSLECFKKSLLLFDETDNKIETSSVQNNLGITYRLMGKYVEAITWFNKAINTKKELKDTINLANTYESIGQVYEKVENYNKSIELYYESLRLQSLLNNKNGIADDYTSLARIYIKTNNYQKAYDLLLKSEDIAQKLENYIAIKENKRLLSEYYLAIGNPYQSREMMQQYALVTEKLFNKQISDRMAEISVQYETEQKDYQNKLLQVNLEIEKYKLQRSNDIQNFLITLSILFIALLLYSLFLLKRLGKKNKIIEQFNDELTNLNFELEEKVEVRTKELSEALYRAEQSDRLKSAFLANMSHEIRTPMNGILGFAKILENDNIPATDRKLYVDVINHQGRNLLQIINDIISLSKIETDQLEIKNSICSVNKIIDDLNLMFNRSGYLNKKKGVELKVEKPLKDNECNIVTDPVRVEQIIKNLVDNALKFTSNGEVVFGYSIEKSNTINFFVRDTGIGIPKDQQEKIFDRFYRHIQHSQPSQSGAGLGLSISKKLATLIGGELWMESEPDKGSTFFLTIPYMHVEMNNVTTPTYEIEKKLFQWPDKVILVVEDDNISFQYIEALLLAIKVKVIHAKNGEEAVSICQSNKHIDLILMDIQLPFMSGYETTIQIKAIRKDLPIVAQTANVLNDERNRSLEAGCSYYISKPIDPEELYGIISKCLDKNIEKSM
jgi:signal transduction histidine kinase/ActR/RegA family two-component response regulator